MSFQCYYQRNELGPLRVMKSYEATLLTSRQAAAKLPTTSKRPRACGEVGVARYQKMASVIVDKRRVQIFSLEMWNARVTLTW